MGVTGRGRRIGEDSRKEETREMIGDMGSQRKRGGRDGEKSVEKDRIRV